MNVCLSLHVAAKFVSVELTVTRSHYTLCVLVLMTVLFSGPWLKGRYLCNCCFFWHVLEDSLVTHSSYLLLFIDNDKTPLKYILHFNWGCLKGVWDSKTGAHNSREWAEQMPPWQKDFSDSQITSMWFLSVTREVTYSVTLRTDYLDGPHFCCTILWPWWESLFSFFFPPLLI